MPVAKLPVCCSQLQLEMIMVGIASISQKHFVNIGVMPASDRLGDLAETQQGILGP